MKSNANSNAATAPQRFPGFPRGVRSIGVPAPMFGELLARIDDLAELKCALRMIWLLQQKRGLPRFVSLQEALADRVLTSALAPYGPDAAQKSLDACARRGVLAMAAIGNANGEQEYLYALNTEADRLALSRVADNAVVVGYSDAHDAPLPWDPSAERLNIFALYEANIGLLSPMLAEELKDAETRYPTEWIEDAFGEAAAQNKRNWRYISRILERWEREGKSGGQFYGRGPVNRPPPNANTSPAAGATNGKPERYSKQTNRY